jgi:hypothetical protein
MMEEIQRTKEKGQSLVLLVILILGMLAVLALVLDGGNTFGKRRLAQNAADAGALAGARTLCIMDDPSSAVTVANSYALSNLPGSVNDVDIDERMVTVTSTLTFDTFFAHMIGYPELTAQASAQAGCCNPTSGTGMLPIAWICRPPITGDSDSEDCQEQALTHAELQYYLDNPLPPGEIYPELYVVMDSSALPDDLLYNCISQGGILDCDFDDDGDDDLIANGDRSWLDLNGGGGGASELSDWIDNGFSGDLNEHTWLGGQPGVANSVFQTVGDHVGEIVLVPVFDIICDDYPDPDCASDIHPQDTILTSAGGSYYFHVVSFAAFYISCVNAPGVPGPNCPGHDVAVDLGVIDNNTKTIEGYFVIGVDPNLDSDCEGGLDLGVYTLQLTK